MTLFAQPTPFQTGSAIAAAFSKLSKLDLESLEFYFGDYFELDDDFYDSEDPNASMSANLELQDRLSTAITEITKPLCLKTLCLNGILALPLKAHKSPLFGANLCSSLTSLTIKSCTPNDLEGACSNEQYNHFWTVTVREAFLIPARASLTSLTLHGDLVGPTVELD